MPNKDGVVQVWRRVSNVILCAVLVAAPIGAAQERGVGTVLKQLRETIAKVRTMSGPSMARTNEAEHLVELTKQIEPKQVDYKTLTDLTSLLDITDDSVRGWVAGALGYLGPRARAAAPALLKVIRDTDCELTDLTPASAARVALKRMGVKPPPRNCKDK